MTKRAHWYRTSPKSWQMREVESDGTENGSGYLDDTRTGFAWSTSQWIPDNKGSANEQTEAGKETTYRQARDRILAVFRIQPRNIDYFLAVGNRNPKRVTANEVEPKARKPSKPTTIKRTSKAARARQPKKSGKGAWAKIRAFVMPRKKKAKTQR